MNTTALAILQAEELDTIQRTGRLLANSGYFDGKGDSPQAIAMMASKILAGREIGIGPFASVNGIHIISGKPAIGANLMASAVKSSSRYDYRVRELTNEMCKIEFFQRNGEKWESIGISEFSKADAAKADTKNMDKFPKNMLFARAMSNGVRFYTPDIFSGNAVYVPEELGAEVDGDGNVVDTTYTVSHTDARHEAQGTSTLGSTTMQRSNAQRPATPATEDVDTDSNGDVSFGATTTPWYVVARSHLTNGTASLADKMLEIHRNGDGPCSEKQYQYLSGLIDSLPGVGQGGHNKVLSVICLTEISGGNRPSFDLATKLLDYLPTHTKVDGNKIANPNYRSDVVEHIVKIANSLQMTLPLAA